MELGQQAKNYLQEAAKWATFLSIIGFIGIGLMIILSFTIGTVLSNLPEGYLGGISPQFFSFFYLIFAGIYFIPVYYLFIFGSKTKKAIINNDTDLLTFGFKKLKSHYKFIGIIAIIGISLYIILMMIGLLGALIAG
jgi:uncharacterized membrane protein